MSNWREQVRRSVRQIAKDHGAWDIGETPRVPIPDDPLPPTPPDIFKKKYLTKKVIESERNRLYNIIMERIDYYLNTEYPSPKKYDRTNPSQWKESIRVEVIRVSRRWALQINFDEEIGLHPSYINEEEQPYGFVPFLMEFGWDIRDKIPYEAYRFTHFEGTHYLKDSINTFNEVNPYKVRVVVDQTLFNKYRAMG